MPRRRDFSFTLALCLSLAVHAWLMQQMIRQFLADHVPLYLPGLVRDVAVTQAVAPLPPPQVAMPLDRFDRLGETVGSGQALAESPGEAPLQAPPAEQAQAALSLDPQGAGRGGTAPAVSVLAVPMPSAMAVPGSAVSSAAMPRLNPRRPERLAGPVLPQAAQPSPEPRPRASPVSPAISRREEEVAGAASASVAGESADPAVQSDRESDAFSSTPYAEFSRGYTRAGVGRAHRLINPRLEMAGYADLLSLRPPVVLVLRITINSAGHVIKAEVVKSTGSINLDQPVMNVVYRWWFEPRNDGKEETFEFACRFL